MTLRYVILIISYALKLIASQDVEINKDDRREPIVIQFLKEGINEELGYFRPPNEHGPLMEVVKDNALHELLKEDDSDLAFGGITTTEQINKYEERAKLKGLDAIRAFTEYIDSQLNLTSAVLDPIAKKITSEYISMLKKYFSGLSRESFDSKIDQEYVILDMVSVASLIRGKVEKKLLKEILAVYDDTPEDIVEILTVTLDTILDNDKQREMDYMCTNFKVCRPKPTISDYLFKLLNEVLKLEKYKFHYFIVKCSHELLKKQSLFKSLLRNEIFVLLREKLIDTPKTNVQELRKAISFLQSIAIRRYKSSPSKNTEIQIKAKSAYIILDIVDVAFGIDGNDVYGIQMEKTISWIKKWSDTTINDNIETIPTILHDFIQYFMEALNYNLTTLARKEIMALADILFDYRNHDEPKNQNETAYLLTEGSKFIKGLLHPPEHIKPLL